MIRRIAQKDPEAFKEFVERYQALVYSVCLNLLHDHPQAQDVSQEVFLQVYRSAAKFRFESKASTWLYRIAVNHSLNLIRHNRRSRWLLSLSPYEAEDDPKIRILPDARSAPPDKAFEDAERSELVRRAVAALPDKQRAALVLHKYEGFTSREIAEILGIPLTAVEARLRRAKSHLRQKFLAYLKNERT